MFELSCWLFPSKCRLVKLYFMSWRIILRHHGPYCRDRSLRSGLILGLVVTCLFKLFCGIILVVCIFKELLKLSFGLLSGLDGIHKLYGLSWRIVLRDIRSHSCDWKLHFGILFSCFSIFVFKLFIWYQPKQLWINKLCRLLSRNLFGFDWRLNL